MNLHRSACRVLPLLMILAMASAVRAEVVTIAWDAAGKFQHGQDIAPGKFAEVCGKLNRDQAIRWSFQANAPLNFNIHYHEGPTVVIPVQRAASLGGTGIYHVTLAHDYCAMWETGPLGTAVSYRVRPIKGDR